MKESEIKAPSNIFIIAGRVGWISGSNSQKNPLIAFAEFSKHGSFSLSRRHGKRVNITFMGHAESLRAEQTLLRTREVSRRWNRINESIRKKFKDNPYRGFNPYFADEGWTP